MRSAPVIAVKSKPFYINGQSASSVERILLRHCGDFVSPLLSSNIIDNETANALQAESIGTVTQVPPDLKRFYFGQVTCPAVSELALSQLFN
jgi:hypothetical protein